MEEILKLENVSLTYQSETGETQAVKNLSFSVKSGQFIAIIGPSGCGKTTVLSLIDGLIKPTSGKIFFKGSENVLTTKHIGYMLQRDELFSWRTIENNVFLPLEIKKINNTKNREYAKSLIDKYGLGEFKKAYPYELSGGMRQRAALIRTLVFNPEILLLDEPFSALDYQTRLNVCNDVYSIISQEKKTAVLVTHDISEAISMADEVLVLSKRPATVLYRHVLDLDKSKTPLKRRKDKNFAKWFDLLWKELHDEA